MKTETISVEEFHEQSDSLIRKAAGRRNRIAVAQDGMIVAALVSASDLERLEEIELRRDEKIQLVKRIRETFAGIPEDELVREGERALREVRQEMDRERHASSPSGQ
jgi:PHD/YefM family antitoxin component YafN of YafNO toxin-antitoxin module